MDGPLTRVRVSGSLLALLTYEYPGEYGLMKSAESIHWTGVTESNGDWDEDIAIGTGGVGEHGRSLHRKKSPQVLE